MAADTIKIGTLDIPWTFVQLVRRKHDGDWDFTMETFYRARNCTTAKAMMMYVQAGFRKRKVTDKNKCTIPYNYLPSTERENGLFDVIRTWWKQCYTPKEKTGPSTAKSIMRAALIEMANNL